MGLVCQGPTAKSADIARPYGSAIRYIVLLLVFEIRSRLVCGTTVGAVLALAPLLFTVHRLGDSFRRQLVKQHKQIYKWGSCQDRLMPFDATGISSWHGFAQTCPSRAN